MSDPRERTKILEEEIVLARSKIDQLNKRISDLERENEEIRDAFRETKTQIQALRDFAYTDRSKWKEGKKNSDPNQGGQE
jgi:predicted  nucleic acid-binding Zn-ribbon protein